MGKNNNIESKNNQKNSQKKGFFTLALAASMLFPVLKGNANTTLSLKQKDISTDIFQNMNETRDPNTYYGLNEKIDKDSTAIDYLKNNLYIKGVSIQDPRLNAEITKIGENKYSIKYNHEFEGITNFSEPTDKRVNIEVTFTYKDNNIYISFEDVTIGKYKLDNIGTLSLKNVIYDYNVVGGEKTNKVLYFNSKANPYKTFEKIEDKIQEKEFVIPKTFKEIKEFENTQLTLLNDIKVGEEVFQEEGCSYREILLIGNGQYLPLTKMYFDKYGNLDTNKTKEEFDKSNTKVLGVDINFILKNDTLRYDRNSAINLIKKVESDKKALISLIDNAKIGPNSEFTGFNKILGVRAWSNGKDLWLFNTTLIGVDLVNSEYTFARGEDKKETIGFVVDSNEGGTPSISMVNGNHEKVNNICVSTNDGFFRINLSGNQLTIDKIKREGQNITEQLPEYKGNQTITNIIMKKTNHYYDGSTLKYADDNGDVITNIKCKKEEKGTFSIEKQSTDINIVDLYNSKKFRDLTKEIKRIGDKVGVLDVDIMNDFAILLEKNGIKLNNQNVIRVDNKGEIYYCTIDKKYNVQIDEKLYLGVEETLNIIKEKLYIIEKINKRKILWKNQRQTQNFENFVGGPHGIGKILIPENDINNFISGNTNEVPANILWGEGEQTVIVYSVSKKGKITPKNTGEKEVTISGMKYKINVDKKTGDIIVDPIEKK